MKYTTFHALTLIHFYQKFIKQELRGGVVHGLILPGPEDPREVVRQEASQHQIGVGDGERAALPVAGRARLRRGRLRSDREHSGVKEEHGAAAGRYRVDVELRALKAVAGRDRLECVLVVAGEAGHLYECES